MSLTNAAFKVDACALASAVDSLVKLTASCDDGDLECLHESGHLPTGVLQFIKAVRAANG